MWAGADKDLDMLHRESDNRHLIDMNGTTHGPSGCGADCEVDEPYTGGNGWDVAISARVARVVSFITNQFMVDTSISVTSVTGQT